MIHRQVYDVAVRLLRGEVIEVTDYRGRTWRATYAALTRLDGSHHERAAVGAYDVAETLVWWWATERIEPIRESARAVA